MEEKINDFYKFNQRLMREIKPKQTALIIVDMQKYQVQKDYAAYKATNNIAPGLLDYFVEEVDKKVIPNLRELIDFCHEVAITIIYTKFSSFMPDGSDYTSNIKYLNEVSNNLIGEVVFPHISHHGSDIVDDLKPEDRDFVLQKNTSGTFMSTRLDSFLRNMDIETVLVAGVVTNFCVHSTAREAADYGFQAIIVEDCCAAWSPEIHEFSLKSFGLLYGYIVPRKKIMNKISKIIKKEKKVLAIH